MTIEQAKKQLLSVNSKFTYELLTYGYSEKQVWAMYYKYFTKKEQPLYTQDDLAYSIMLDEQRVQEKLQPMKWTELDPNVPF